MRDHINDNFPNYKLSATFKTLGFAINTINAHRNTRAAKAKLSIQDIKILPISPARKIQLINTISIPRLTYGSLFSIPSLAIIKNIGTQILRIHFNNTQSTRERNLTFPLTTNFIKTDPLAAKTLATLTTFRDHFLFNTQNQMTIELLLHQLTDPKPRTNNPFKPIIDLFQHLNWDIDVYQWRIHSPLGHTFSLLSPDNVFLNNFRLAFSIYYTTNASKMEKQQLTPQYLHRSRRNHSAPP